MTLRVKSVVFGVLVRCRLFPLNDQAGDPPEWSLSANRAGIGVVLRLLGAVNETSPPKISASGRGCRRAERRLGLCLGTSLPGAASESNPADCAWWHGRRSRAPDRPMV